MKKNDILVTTTSSIEGHRIEKYLKTVSAHIVVGNNLFSDIAASFTDFFGGFSNSYQNKLTLIYNKALSEIKKETRDLGGNSVIGLKLDFDQISGKGTSMFMLTATGTAVYLKPDQVQSDIQLVSKPNLLFGIEIDIALQKKKIKLELQDKSLTPFDDSKWDFIIENRYSDICFDLLEHAMIWSKSGVVAFSEDISNKVKNYLQNLPDEEEKKLLYDLYLNDKYSSFKKIILDTIRSKSILDNERLISLVQSIAIPDKNIYKIFDLIVVRAEKVLYSDLAQYKTLSNLIRQKFTYLVEFQKQKKLLSSTEIDIWLCRCKTKNPIDVYNCSNCGCDKYGFPRGHINPDKVIQWLENTIDILEDLISDES